MRQHTNIFLPTPPQPQVGTLLLQISVPPKQISQGFQVAIHRALFLPTKTVFYQTHQKKEDLVIISITTAKPGTTPTNNTPTQHLQILPGRTSDLSQTLWLTMKLSKVQQALPPHP